MSKKDWATVFSQSLQCGYIYIYIYIYRERERERRRIGAGGPCVIIMWHGLRTLNSVIPAHECVQVVPPEIYTKPPTSVNLDGPAGVEPAWCKSWFVTISYRCTVGLLLSFLYWFWTGLSGVFQLHPTCLPVWSPGKIPMPVINGESFLFPFPL